MLYELPLEQVLGLDHSCADTSGGGFSIRLDGDWVSVDEPVAKLLREVVAQSGDTRDSRLFPGRLRGDRFSVGGVQYYLEEALVS